MSGQHGDRDAGEDTVVRRFRELAKATQNPVYAWLAIDYMFQGKDGLLPDWPTDKTFALPGWIAAYLQRAAELIQMLASGLDFRVEVPPLDFARFSTIDDVMNSDEFRQRVDARRIEPANAMDRVPAALGFTREGWNAFASCAATTSKMQEFRAYETMRAQGISAKVAADAIGTEIGVADRSTVYDRVRQGRELAAGGKVGNSPQADSRSGDHTL